jgi:Concanavalin A-like lectin/glucanases superfamily
MPVRHRHGRGRIVITAVVLALVLLVVPAVTLVLLHRGNRGLAYNAAVLADRPVAFWNVGASGATETDLTRHGHTGTYERGRPTRASMPNGNSAADFNGQGEYLSIPSSAELSIASTQELTWEAWIRPSELQFSGASDPSGLGYVNWMGKCATNSSNCEWSARMYSTANTEQRCNRLSAYAYNLKAAVGTAALGSGAYWQPRCGLLAAGQWLYVVGEYQTVSTPPGCSAASPGTINIWVNGTKQTFIYHSSRTTGSTGCMSQFTVDPKAGNSPLNIGTLGLKSFFPGAIGKVAIYDKLLSQAQINAHYAAMTGSRPFGQCVLGSCAIPVPTP